MTILPPTLPGSWKSLLVGVPPVEMRAFLDGFTDAPADIGGKTDPAPCFTGLLDVDPNGIGQHEPGAKLDAGKPLPWLCVSGFAMALAEVANVSTIGARKYSPNGWKAVADGETRYMNAAMRHLLALGSGETRDKDTGCLHLARLELELRRASE